MIQFDLRILFFKWVGRFNHQLDIFQHLPKGAVWTLRDISTPYHLWWFQPIWSIQQFLCEKTLQRILWIQRLKFHTALEVGVPSSRSGKGWKNSRSPQLKERLVVETQRFRETWHFCHWKQMGVSKIVGFPPKSSILIGFSIINHPF